MTYNRLIGYRQILWLLGSWLLASLIQPVYAQDTSIHAITYGETVGGFFTDTTTLQEWQFAGQAREIIQVTVRRIGGLFTPRVELIAPTGIVLTPTADTADAYEQTLIFREGLPVDGLYVLRIRAENAQPTSDFLTHDYSLSLEQMGLRRTAPDEGVRPLPDISLNDLSNIFEGQSFLAAPINLPVYGIATLSQPEPQTQRNRYVLEGDVTATFNNANPLTNGIDALASARGGFAFRTRNTGTIFFTDSDVVELEILGGIATMELANGQIISTDFYRIAELQAVQGLIVLKMVDGQQIILEGDMFNFRRRGGINGEGPNAEPVNLLTIDGTTIETDLSGWQTFAVIQDAGGRYVRVEYGQDMRFIADTMNINLFGRGNSARPELNPPDLNTNIIDITVKREDNPLPIEVDPTGMGDVLLTEGELRIEPLDGRLLSVEAANVTRLIIENLGVRYTKRDGTYLLSLPDGTRIDTPAVVPDNAQALPAQEGYRPRFYNNLGTHIFDYHPDLNFTRALMPVNLVNGNFYYAVEDFAVPSHTLELNWTRHYNSLAPLSQTPDYMHQNYLFGQIGSHWRHSYQIDLDIRYAPIGQVRVILPDGGTYTFNATNDQRSRFRSEHLLSWTIERVSGLTGTWRATTTEGVIYDFDRAGRLQRMTDANNLSLLFSPMPSQFAASYDMPQGFTVTDAYGRRLELYTNSAGQITVARGIQGQEIHYSYGGDLLTDVRYPGADQTATYGYAANVLTDIEDTRSPYHQSMNVAYNNNGQVTAYTFSPNGSASRTTTLTYLSEGETSVVNETLTVNGTSRSHRWIADNQFRLIQWQMPKPDWLMRWNYDLETARLSEFILPTRAILRFVFDEFGYLVRYTDPNFTATPYQFTYNDTVSGLRLLMRIDYPGFNDTLVFDTFTYDETNRLSRVIRPIETFPRRIEQITDYTYDDWGRLTSVARLLDDETSVTTAYTYDEFGYIASVAEGNNSRVSRLLHDVAGRLRLILDGRGTRYVIGWDDERDLVTGVQIGNDTEPALNIAYDYDAFGNLATYTYQGATEQYTYDELNHLQTVTDAQGRITSYDYDENSNLLTITPPNATAPSVTYAYDELDFLAASQTSEDLITRYETSLLIERNQTQSSIIYPTGERFDYIYNALGRLSIVRGTATQLASSERRTFEYSLDYNAPGYLIRVRDSFTGQRTLTLNYNLVGDVISSSIGNVTTEYKYDRLGRLLTVTDPEERVTSYAYDNANNIVSVITPDGAANTYTYDANGNITTFTDGLGHEYQFMYDALNRLTSATDPMGHTTLYAYDIRGNLISQQNPLGATITAEYDNLDRLLRLRDATGVETAFTYNDLDQLIQVSEGNGLLRTDIVYDSEGFASAISQPGNRRLLFGRDSFGRLITRTNSLGYTTSYSYNRYGFIESIVNPLGDEQRYNYTSIGQIASFTDFGGDIYNYLSENVSSDSSDSIGRLTQLADTATGIITRIGYDDSGYITSIRFGSRGTVAGLQATVHSYTYDANGRLITYRPPESDADWRFEYDEQGRITQVTNPEGQIARYDYDTADHITQIVRSSQSDAGVEFLETFAYNALGQVTEYTAPDGFTSTFVYDASSRLIERIDGGTRRTQFAYDEFGRLRQYIDASGNTTIYRYDEFGNVIGIERTLNTSEQPTTHTYRFEYDTASNLTRIVYPGGEQYTQAYNVLNQRVRFIDPLNNGWSYSYDASGNLIQLSDPLGNSVTYEYDTGNRLIAISYANSDPINFTYDENGHLSGVRLPENGNELRERIEYGIDRNGSLVEIEYANEGNDRVQYERDNLGRITSMTYYSRDNENGNVTPLETQFVYNSQGQIAELIPPNSTPILRDYDEGGRLIRITGADGTTNFEYDEQDFGQLLQIRSVPLDANYEYDAVGNLTVRDIDGIGRVEYEYDTLYRPIRVTVNGVGMNITYDVNGRRTSIVRDNGIETRYVYDANGRILRVIHTNADGERLGFFAYDYDVAGNIIRVTRGDNTSVLYSYDARQQLISERWLDSSNQAVYSVSYRYDDAGNRIERVTRENQQNPRRTIYTYNERNQLILEVQDAVEQRMMLPAIVGITALVPLLWFIRRKRRYLPFALIVVPFSMPFFQVNTTIQQLQYTYNTTGTLMSVVDDNGNTLAYGYDAFNRLISISGTNRNRLAIELDLAYDSMGRLVSVVTSEAGAAPTEYELLYDALGLVSINNVADDTETHYFSVFPDEILMMEENGVVQFPLHDALGTIRRLADENGEVPANEAGEPLGIDIGAFGEHLQPYGVETAYPVTELMPVWIGQLYEPVSETYTMGVRTYDPQLGRFIQRDPVRHDPRGNLYTYAYNRPTVYSDTTGLSPETGFGGLSPDIDDADDFLSITSPLLPTEPIVTTVHEAQAEENYRLLTLAETVYYDFNTVTGMIDPAFCDFYTHQAHPIPDSVREQLQQQSESFIGLYTVSNGWQLSLPDARIPVDTIAPLGEMISDTRTVEPYPLQGCDRSLQLPQVPNPQAAFSNITAQLTLNDMLTETSLFQVTEMEVAALLQAGQFPEVSLPTVEVLPVQVHSTPPLTGQIARLRDDTHTFYAEILLPESFGLDYEWRRLAQVYDTSPPVVRRVR